MVGRLEGVTLQFQPDWGFGERTVVEAIAESGLYLSQFATGISNGGLTAFVGGDRWRWESRLFSARYDGSPATDRPVYGAWNRRGDPYGGAIRFGSSYFRLRPEVLDRTTFCFPDSVFDPVDVGDKTQLPHLCRLADAADSDDLDDYVEAHVHGPVRCDTDVDALVLDPSFAGTPIESAARRLGCGVEFHAGFKATPNQFDPAYRAKPRSNWPARSAESSPHDSWATPPRSGQHPPQIIKFVWHLLARFGRRPTNVRE